MSSDSAKSKIKRKPAQPFASSSALASSHAPSPEPEHSQFGESVVADANFKLWLGHYAARNNQPIDAERWKPLHRAQNSPLFRSAKSSGQRVPKLEFGGSASDRQAMDELARLGSALDLADELGQRISKLSEIASCNDQPTQRESPRAARAMVSSARWTTPPKPATQAFAPLTTGN